MDPNRDRVAKAESLAKARRWNEAAKVCAELIATGHSDFRVHFCYGTVLLQCGRHQAARDQLCAALRYSPVSLEALDNLAAVELKLDAPCAAEETCRLVLARQPDHPIAWSNLGLALSRQGRVTEGIEALQRALAMGFGDRIVRDNLLLNLNYLATDGRDLVEAHRLLCGKLPSSPPKPLPQVQGRRIRVGYLSSDFRSHSVSFFMAGIIGTHDRRAFEIFCYSTTQVPDARTEDFRLLAEHFVDLASCPDTEAARRIEGDQVDILVDLAGHSSGNRLDIFALRPAPVQITYLGYPATTGCPFMDYRLVDDLTDPEGSDALSTERLVRLPAPFLCYYPHTTFPQTVPLPALENGFITFGSFNHSSKISDDTLDLWSRILRGVPGSRMFLKARAFADAGVREGFRKRFASRGLDSSRLDFSGIIESTQEHLGAYGKVDIALDTFPYNGTTTTCEALWMGVPVISLVGDLHAARVGYTILTAVGLGDLATASAEDYVALAATFAEDKHQLASLRSHLQKVVEHSPLCDRFQFTKGLEDAYRKMLSSGA